MSALGSRLLVPSLGAALLLAAAMHGCAVEGFVLVDATSSTGSASLGGAGGSGVGAGVTTGGTGGSGAGECAHITWPVPPAGSDPGPNGVEVVVVVRQVNFGEDEVSEGVTVGFDLDKECTCLGDGSSCKAPPDPSTDGCDGPDGIDNVGAGLVVAAQLLDDRVSSAAQTARAETGDGSLLIRVRDYNGLLNDTQVSVSIFSSPGVDKDPCFQMGTTPKWDGADRWSILASTIKGTPGQDDGMCGNIDHAAKFQDDSAYVNEGVLVASLPALTVNLTSDDNPPGVTLTSAFVTGRLIQKAGVWHLTEGILAGRWKSDDVFKTLSAMRADGMELCQDHPSYGVIKSFVCGSRDITAIPGGPTASCDSISTGIAIEAEAARIGVSFTPVNGGNMCGAGNDPAEDSCG